MSQEPHYTHCISNSSSDHSYKDYGDKIKNLDDVTLESLLLNNNNNQFNTKIINLLENKKQKHINIVRKPISRNNNQKINIKNLIINRIDEISIKPIAKPLKIYKNYEYQYKSSVIKRVSKEWNNYHEVVVLSREVEFDYHSNKKDNSKYRIQGTSGGITNKVFYLEKEKKSIEEKEKINENKGLSNKETRREDNNESIVNEEIPSNNEITDNNIDSLDNGIHNDVMVEQADDFIIKSNKKKNQDNQSNKIIMLKPFDDEKEEYKIKQNKPIFGIQVSTIREIGNTIDKNEQAKPKVSSKVIIESIDKVKNPVSSEIFTQDIKNEIEKNEYDNPNEDNDLKILLNDTIPPMNIKRCKSMKNTTNLNLNKEPKNNSSSIHSSSTNTKNVDNSSTISKKRYNHIEEDKETIQEEEKSLLEKRLIQKVLKKTNSLIPTSPTLSESVFQFNKSTSKIKFPKHLGNVDNCPICQEKLKKRLEERMKKFSPKGKTIHSCNCYNKNSYNKSLSNWNKGSMFKLKKTPSTLGLFSSRSSKSSFMNSNEYMTPYAIYVNEKIYGSHTSRKAKYIPSGKSLSLSKRQYEDKSTKIIYNKSMNQNFVPVIDSGKCFIGIIKRKDIIQYLSTKLAKAQEAMKGK